LEKRGANEAVADFIAVSELQQQDTIRTARQWGFDELGDRYAIVDSGKEKYLVEFRRRCHELDQNTVTPDVRYQRNVLRARFDTIRGCAIWRLYAIDDAPAQELQQLVNAMERDD
jgi:hypothetical protein